MLREIPKRRFDEKLTLDTVRLSKRNIRVGQSIIDKELELLQDKGYEVTIKDLYLKLAADDDGQFWFVILPYRVDNSTKVVVNKHVGGYTYFIVQYTLIARQRDGITLREGNYSAMVVDEQEDFRWRRLDSMITRKRAKLKRKKR